MALFTLPVLGAFDEMVELVAGVLGFCYLPFDLTGEGVLGMAAARDGVFFLSFFLCDSPKDLEGDWCISID